MRSDSDRTADPIREPDKTQDTGRPRVGMARGTREREKERHRGSHRETIESVVIAFVLAFLFRTFEAEAFVIPTGSMAPTLMGRHKEVACQQCDWVFTVGASERPDGGPTEGVCPNCSFRNDIADEPVFKGDRILVLKALYDLPDWSPDWLRQPQRWDVVVFKFPEEPQVNYIKRLVGLPGEHVRVHMGNIYSRADGAADYRIARKSPEKQQVLRMIVYDNSHPPRQPPAHWPPRWQVEPGGGWESNDGQTFDHSGPAPAGDWSRLTYHHLVRRWDGTEGPSVEPSREAVTDFYAYNEGGDANWVGDLTLTARVDVAEPVGKLRLELVEAADRFSCEFNLRSGECRLLKIAVPGGSEQLLAVAQNVISRPGSYSISFANVDDRLTVWVDGKLPFGDGHDYDGLSVYEEQRATEADNRPATVAAEGARVRVSDLVLYRDIYYTAASAGYGDSQEYQLGPDDFLMMGDNSPRSKDGRLWREGGRRWLYQLALERNLTELLREDPQHRDAYLDVARDFDFQLAQNQDLRPVYERLVSLLARQGRRPPNPMEELEKEVRNRPGGDVLDAEPHVVRRQLLIGKAFFVYWPHGVPFGPEWLQFDVRLPGRWSRLGTFRLPFYPNVKRMKRIK